jgi:predicted nuclease of predicted toxin-antitoxin system
MKILIDMNLFPTWGTTFTTIKIESAYLEALITLDTLRSRAKMSPVN